MGKHKYTNEFKLEAAKLVVEQGYTHITAAKTLDVNVKNLNRWVADLKKKSSSKTAKMLLTTEQEELVRLRKENKRLQMERDILKKATAFFASESL
jgi:transposase